MSTSVGSSVLFCILPHASALFQYSDDLPPTLRGELSHQHNSRLSTVLCPKWARWQVLQQERTNVLLRNILLTCFRMIKSSSHNADAYIFVGNTTRRPYGQAEKLVVNGNIGSTEQIINFTTYPVQRKPSSLPLLLASFFFFFHHAEPALSCQPTIIAP